MCHVLSIIRFISAFAFDALSWYAQLCTQPSKWIFMEVLDYTRF